MCENMTAFQMRRTPTGPGAQQENDKNGNKMFDQVAKQNIQTNSRRDNPRPSLEEVPLTSRSDAWLRAHRRHRNPLSCP